MKFALTKRVDRIVLHAPVVKRCPFVDEEDRGTVTVTYFPKDAALEIHAFAGHLETYRGIAISHEELTAELAEWVLATTGAFGAEVEGWFITAGMDIEVRAQRYG